MDCCRISRSYGLRRCRRCDEQYLNCGHLTYDKSTGEDP